VSNGSQSDASLTKAWTGHWTQSQNVGGAHNPQLSSVQVVRHLYRMFAFLQLAMSSNKNQNSSLFNRNMYQIPTVVPVTYTAW